MNREGEKLFKRRKANIHLLDINIEIEINIVIAYYYYYYSPIKNYYVVN